VRPLGPISRCDAKLTDWLANITADCPQRLKPGYADPCGARCPDLPKVL
jgi:hypothetical protein